MKKAISVVLMLILIVSTIPAFSAGNTLSVEDGEILYSLPEYFTVTGAYGSTVVYYLNDELIGIGNEFGEIEVPDLAYGKYNLKAVLISGSRSEVVSSDFSYAKRAVTMSQNENFDVFYSEEDSKIASERVSSEVARVGFALYNGYNADAYYAPGASGEEGDGAFKLEVNTDEKLVAYNAYFESTKFKGFSDGITEIEFDIKFASDKADQIRFTDLHMWPGAGTDLIKDGKWGGTQIAVGTGWSHVKIINDSVREKVSFELNGNVIVDNADYLQSSSYINESIRYTLVQEIPRNPGEVRAGFSIDNFRAENFKLYEGIQNVTAVVSGEEMPEEDFVSYDADELRVNFSDPLNPSTVSKKTVSLKTTYGKQISLDSVECIGEGKTISIIPKEALMPGEDYIVIISGDTQYLDGVDFDIPYEAVFSTNPAYIDNSVELLTNGNPLYISDQIRRGRPLTAVVNYENVSGDQLDATYILTARKDGRLVAITSSTVSFSEGEEGTFEFGFDSETDVSGCQIQLIVCDSLEKMNALDKFILIS